MISTPEVRTPRGQRIAPNDIAEMLTGRPHVSFSEISTYQACPLKWQFQYVEKATPESVSAAMLLGSCVHEVIHRHFEGVMADEQTPAIDELMGVYQARWDNESQSIPVQFAQKQDAESMTATARRMIEQFLASPHARPEGEIIGLEEPFRVGLDPDLPDLAGTVDMITRHGDELVVTDFKTARSMWTEESADDHAEQLTLYSQGCRPIARNLEALIRLQFIVITKTKEPKVEAFRVDVDEDRVRRSKAIIRQVFRAMQTGVVYPAPSLMGCSGCPFQRRCGAWHRTQVDRP